MHGIYFEIVVGGTPRAVALLGYVGSDYSTASYGALYLYEMRRRRRKPGNMLFLPTKKLR